MCGIIAALSKHRGITHEPLARATRQLRHRGPDAQHVWVSPDARAGLGHARLSIIDLETGDQPIANEDGRLRIVANGEFYDFERIRCELEREGHAFRTRSDSEIALHLFEDRGARALHSLRGEFAFAIWDERDGQLFAARDRFGIKPLYYTVHDGTFYLASEVKALAALGVPLRWDRETLYDMHFVSHPPDRTLFAGVYQLPPASYLLTDGEQVRVIPVLGLGLPDRARRRESNGDGREWVRRLERSLEEAVRLRLRADVPVACYLSGGIDSCAVLGFASRLSSKPLRAYTLSFDHADYDEERPGARAGSAVWSRVLPHRHSGGPARRSFQRRDLSRRASVRERACGRQVPAQPSGPRFRHQGGAHRRRQRRDLRRLSALPARSRAVRQAMGRTRRRRRACSPSSRRPTACRPERSCPRGRWRSTA